MGKKCILIGGAGFIGARMAAHLAGCGYDITICDCLDRQSLPLEIKRLKYLELNYFEEKIADEIIRKQDMAVLLISSVNPQTSMDEPEKCYDKDITRMIQLLDQLRRCKVNRLVFISSGGTVYGNQKAEILSEDMPTFPVNHYGVMKLTQEKILIMYNRLFGMNNIIFRLANPYGSGQRVSSGVGIVTTALRRIMNGETITIYGKGEVIRDYIYIDDAVGMMQKMLDQETQKYDAPVFNIGTGRGTNIMEVIGIAEKVLEKKAKLQFVPERGIDVERNVLDISRLRSAIGSFQCRSLEEGIGQYYSKMKEMEINKDEAGYDRSGISL